MQYYFRSYLVLLSSHSTFKSSHKYTHEIQEEENYTLLSENTGNVLEEYAKLEYYYNYLWKI